jgi:hypothetical protein
LIGGVGTVESEGMDEHRVKVGYMYNFLARSVFWQRKISPMATGIGNVCIIGDMKLGYWFKTMVQNSSNYGLRINLEYSIGKGKIPEGCHILFIGKTASHRVSYILEQTRNRPILTVSDMKGFIEKGGMVEFVRVKQNGMTNIKTRINPVTAEENGIVMGAELMLLSDMIERKELMIITDHLH